MKKNEHQLSKQRREVIRAVGETAVTENQCEKGRLQKNGCRHAESPRRSSGTAQAVAVYGSNRHFSQEWGTCMSFDSKSSQIREADRWVLESCL